MGDGDPRDARPLRAPYNSRWARAAGAFGLGGGLLATYLWVVGPDAVVRVLGDVPPRRLVSLAVVGLAPIVLWGCGLHLILARFGIAERLTRSLLLFSATAFLNNVTPFGQAGGSPVSAVLIERSLPTDFETGLAAIGSLNALNRVASLSLGLIGVGYLGTGIASGWGLGAAAESAVGAVATVLAAVVSWRYRRRVVRIVVTVLARVLAPTRRLPGVTPPSRDGLVARGDRFVRAVERLAAAPGTLGIVFVAGIAGQFAVASALWVALAAVGVDAPLPVVLLLIPVARLSGASPTPGGLGSAEAVLGALLIATIGVDAAAASAAALLYRTGAFWLPSLCGGMAAAWWVGREPDPDDGTSDATPRSSEAATASTAPDGSRLSVPLVAVSVPLVVLLTVTVHRGGLLVEPESLLVHTTRDAALAVLGLGATWLALRKAAVALFD